MGSFDHIANPAVLNGVAVLEAAGLIAREEQEQERWQLLTLEDALQEREPVRRIMAGLVRPGLVVFFGAPGALKSMLLADLAICVASGRHWLQPAPNECIEPIQVEQCPVLWVDFDNGARRTLDRFGALARGHGVREAALGIYSMPAPRLDASSADSVAKVAAKVKDFGAGLVIIDNLGLIAGADENSADMASAMGNLRWLAEDTCACIVLIHHQRKGNGINARTGETLRGHSSIEAALDAALLVEREEGSAFVNVRATKSRDVLIRAFAAQFAFEHKAGTTDLEAARFWGIAAEGGNEDSDIAHVVLTKVSEQDGITQSALVKAAKSDLPDVGEKRIRAVVADLVRKGDLTQTTGAKGAKCYSRA